MKRVLVVGQTGTGKTTLAQSMAVRLGCPQTELDAIHWQANWQALDVASFRDRVREVVRGECWVIDGNYSKVQDIVLARADTVVWLDYSLALIFWRLTRRTFRRVFLRKHLWNGNRERFHEQFLSRDSLYLWALNTQRAKRARYTALMENATYAHLEFHRFRSPHETNAWLQTLR